MTIADSFTITPADEQATAETIQCLASWCRQLVKIRPSLQTKPEYEIPEYWEWGGTSKLKLLDHKFKPERSTRPTRW
ncbi:hypothetical protein VI817_008055 [Penicillium citrinum]|nr:hypothetical protein VI817_008055 [Penicillium citrinum]